MTYGNWVMPFMIALFAAAWGVNFAVPRRRVLHDAARLYEGLVHLYGCDAALIQTKLCPNLARQYKVSIRAMEIRLEQLGLQKEVAQALRNKFATLDI